MCGRFSLKATPDDLEKVFGTVPPADYRPRYNIAPTQEVLTLRLEEGDRRARMLRWGLVPFWASDPSVGNRMINARAETVAEKPAYRNAFRQRRCVVLADGFYEWQRRPDGKRPMRMRLRSGAPFAFAGLWEKWDRGAAPLETCTILTTAANRFMRPIHERMPVILESDALERWLAPDASQETLAQLLQPCGDDALEAYEVSDLVNNPRHDIPECLDPVDSPAMPPPA